MSDIFADLLKGTGVPAPSKPDAHLSMNERLATCSSSRNNHSVSKSNVDLDFLDTYVSKGNTRLPTTGSAETQGSDLDDFLFSATANPPVTDRPNTQSTAVNNHSEINLLDDLFGQPIPPKTSSQNQRGHGVPSNSGSSSSSNANAYVDPSTGPHTHTQKPMAAQPVQHPLSTEERKDASLAELLDMGFPLSKANTALEHTSDGHNLEEAISYLMTEAHSGSSPKTNGIHSTGTLQQDDDFGKVINDLSQDFMSTASFLFNSGKKKIQQGVEMYRQQRLDNNNGQPLWMKNQHIYKTNSIKMPSFNDNGEEFEEEEMDTQTMQLLIQKQKLREKKLKQQKAMDTDLLSEPSTQPSHLQPSNNMTRPQPRPSPSLDSSSEIYVSSSRHRRKQTASPPIPTAKTPSNAKPVISTATLIETSTVPESSFSVPPLNSAQNMAYSNSKQIAHEKFKSGDYSGSLENYLNASHVIPETHPLQIILFSNISLVYSKLGNPKEQLVYADKGLDLISSNSNNASISDLSKFFIEDNKSMRSFWIKLMMKRAEALEFLEKWKDSKEAYEKLISSGENAKPIMDGKNRCNKVLNPPTVKKQPAKAIRKQTPVASNNEKLERVKASNDKKQREEQEMFDLHDIVELKLNKWRTGNLNNIRALICSLDSILWPQLNWKPVKLTDLVLDKKVKIYYMKAIAKTHPDKISDSESTENKMIANGVFITLNEAWEAFKANNGM